MAIVEFTKDCYPYCAGDRLEMSEEEMKDAEALGEQRNVGKPFKVVADEKPVPPVEEVKAVEETVDETRVDQNLVPQTAAEANLKTPGVEAALAADDQRAAEVAEKQAKTSSRKASK
jgi:hypothetical protein